MALRANAAISVLANIIRLYPKSSLATAFEIGMLAAAALQSARLRRLAGSAGVIDATALPVPARRKRKAIARKRKPARRAKVTVPTEAV